MPSEQFFEQPILNSPYDYPSRHWELDSDGQPTNRIIDNRRSAKFITPVPKPQKRRQSKMNQQTEMVLGEGLGLSSEEQQYDTTSVINAMRGHVDQWRSIPNSAQWQVTPETARLLHYWRHHPFVGIRPFFCQIEAVETAIWLHEVAPKHGKRYQNLLSHIQNANDQANPHLFRIALKLATGAGKTTVMAMLIAWQAINAARHPQNKKFTRGFLIITPGITIRDRLRVLKPNDPDSYYKYRELVPPDMLGDIDRAKIVITNYHAFKLRERMSLSAGGRALLQGHGSAVQTLETEGQMLQRVMPDLMSMKNILVLNDESHHCYREKPQNDEVEHLKGDDKKEAQKNNEAARLWITGVECVKRNMGVQAVYDLSATPFFLRGSGYAEGTLFPWTVSDFSLMDAIECGIVKLPRVPVADNIPGGDMPIFRNLWQNISKKMPKKGRGKAGNTLDPLNLPSELQTALSALYGHYAKTFALWEETGIRVPPVFIVVCNNTATSKLVYDFIAGFEKVDDDGTPHVHAGHLALFRNFDEQGNRLARPRTLLIDSEQLESDEALDKEFWNIAKDEIERFRRELIERSGNLADGQTISDRDLLREVMNTVGKEDRLGESVRCVVSVAMLTEGWDTNTVTHVLGVRAFGTQLLCEQVVGRALRRQSYELNEHGLFNVEYADVFGIPFDFTSQPVVAAPTPPRKTVQVCAVVPEREHLEITFPRVTGYRVDLPIEHLAASFSPDSVLALTPELVGPMVTHNQGLLGTGVDITVDKQEGKRLSTITFYLAKHLLYTNYRDPGEEPKLHLFGQIKRIAQQWMEEGYLDCSGGTYPAMVIEYPDITSMACDRIQSAIQSAAIESVATGTNQSENYPIKVVLDAYNPIGSTMHINFGTAKETLWKTNPCRCQINWVVCDSDWETEFCRVAESHPRVNAYVKNQGLGLEVPYNYGELKRTYLPDFIVQIDDGKPDPLNLIVEIKGFRGEDAKIKAETMRNYWVPGVNNIGTLGRWAFAEFTAVYEIDSAFNTLVEEAFVQPMV